jgi:hypothetical protein
MTRLEVRLDTADAHGIAGDPGTWLPAPARPAGVSLWTTTLHAGPLRRQVTVVVGPVIRAAEERARLITWSPGVRPGDVLPFEVLLPEFTGELVADDSGLRLVGTYEPPVGWLGQVADIALRNAAHDTVRRLLHDIVEALAPVTTSGGRP